MFSYDKNQGFINSTTFIVFEKEMKLKSNALTVRPGKVV